MQFVVWAVQRKMQSSISTKSFLGYFLLGNEAYLNIKHPYMYTKEAVARRCSVKEVPLEISQNSLENACARVSFNKVAGFGLKDGFRWLLLTVKGNRTVFI